MVQQSREATQAKADLESARQTREPLLNRLMGVDGPSFTAMRERLQDAIAKRLSGPLQGVYANKLKSAASDEDLKSLLQDLSRLDAFNQGADDGKESSR